MMCYKLLLYDFLILLGNLILVFTIIVRGFGSVVL